jgi:hypothetical protein
MRTGAQTLADFEDEHALWGYVNAVGSKRAFNVCETFAWLWAHTPAPMSAALSRMAARRPPRLVRGRVRVRVRVRIRVRVRVRVRVGVRVRVRVRVRV